MASPFNYRKLHAWEQGMGLVEQCYQATQKFPDQERYGLTSQIRRAAVSIPSNIAEGHCRRTTKAYLNHVSIALGSQGELETLLELGFRLGFIAATGNAELQSACASVGKLLNGLHRALEIKLRSNTPQPLAPSL